VRTALPDAKAPCPQDRVNREFHAARPNQLWVSDFTYVSTWQGLVHVAFVIDVYARYIVGWRLSRSMRADFVLDALEQALYARKPQRDGERIHHSDRGSRTSRSATPSGWPKPASSRRSAAKAAATTTIACWSRSGASLPPKPRQAAGRGNSPVRPCSPDSHQPASTRAAADHSNRTAPRPCPTSSAFRPY